jgi:type VI protein secretion system component Hcp
MLKQCYAAAEMWARLSRVPKAAALVAVGLLAGGAGFAVASVPDGSGTFHACVLMQTTEGETGTVTEPVIDGVDSDLDGSGIGNLTLIDPSAGQTCDDVAAENGVGSTPYIEQAISWNQTGPAGPQGEAGAQGIQGPTGATGATGATGPAGAQGSAGAKGLKGDKGDKGDTGDKGAPGKSVTVNSSASETDVAAVALSNPVQGAITGESQVSSSTKLAFDALSVDYQAAGPPTNIGSANLGAGSGKATAQTITITKVLDNLSPTLLGATASHQEFRQALIVIPTKGANNDDLRLELTDVVITSDHISTSAGSKPLEQLTLEALGVKIQDVSSQNVNGGLTQQLPGGWNRVLNTADQTTGAITSKAVK